MHFENEVVPGLFGVREIYMWRSSENPLNIWYEFFCVNQIFDKIPFASWVDNTRQILAKTLVRLLWHISIFHMHATWFSCRQNANQMFDEMSRWINWFCFFAHFAVYFFLKKLEPQILKSQDSNLESAEYKYPIKGQPYIRTCKKCIFSWSY